MQSFEELEPEVVTGTSRRKRVERESVTAVVEQVRSAVIDLRRTRRPTQTGFSDATQVAQARLPWIDSKGDMFLSTLAGYVEALGGQLEINAVIDGERIPLTSGQQITSRIPHTVSSFRSGAVREPFQRSRAKVVSGEQVGSNLAKLRRARRIAQGELSRAMQVSQGVISRIERQSDMYVSTLAAYIEVLGGYVEIEAVIDGERIPLTATNTTETLRTSDVVRQSKSMRLG